MGILRGHAGLASVVRFALLGTALFAATPAVGGRVPRSRPWRSRAASAADADDELPLPRGRRARLRPTILCCTGRCVQNLRFAGATESRATRSSSTRRFALAMNEPDPVVRRRLVSRMRWRSSRGAGRRARGAALRASYERNAARLSQAPSASASPSLLPRRARAGRAPELARLRATATLPSARSSSAIRSCRDDQPLQARDELAGRFGADFAGGVFDARPERGRADSVRLRGAPGFVRERQAERALGFEEVRDRVRLALIAERRAAALERGHRRAARRGRAWRSSRHRTDDAIRAGSRDKLRAQRLVDGRASADTPRRRQGCSSIAA